ncbi:MAG: glycosyltransferase, partial [Acidimicrobiia bacterium]
MAEPGAALATRPAPDRGLRRKRPKVAVLAWDVGHNPVGRAYVLAGVLRRRFDTEIWGAQFKRYGTKIWAPLRDCEIPIHAFDGRMFPMHLDVMETMAKEIDADAIYVSKPRLPSYGLGILAKQARNRPLVLDVDDHELAFFDEHDGIDARTLLRSRGDNDVKLPFGRAWTRACEPLVGAADALTVSNVALAERFGGTIVPHARDERVFDPALYDRNETRRRLGVTDTERLLLFGGTPRVHKGIIEVIRALDRLGDDRYRVLVFGTREFDELRGQIGDLERWVLALPYQRFDELPRLVGAADLACVLQDRDHPISRYQLPAKITDALAMNVPCLVTPVPPLRPLIDTGAVQVLEGSTPLHERIAAIFDHYDDAIDRARRGREVFEATYSYEAVTAVLAPRFDQLLEAPPPLSPRLATLVDVPRQLFGSRPTLARPPARVPGRRSRPAHAGAMYDVVVFWKQNDTGIYGRRQDMFVKYLARSGRVRSIVHFDNPTTPERLYKTYRNAGTTADQGRLIVRQTMSRLLHRRDSDQTRYRTFLHGGRLTRRLGLPRRERYPDYVKWVLERRGIGDLPTIFWVYPTNADLPWIIDELDPDIVVADVVDDNRTWHDEDSALYDLIEQNYEDVLTRSDVVLANCEPVAESMKRFAPDVHVVPNGCELPT